MKKVKDKKKNTPKVDGGQEKVDPRFAKVFNDPRFVIAPNKVKKVKIDDRFKGMFTEKQFNVVAKVDKYGRKIDKKDKHVLENYYNAESDQE